MTAPSSRLAPSPTGALHLGNARTFLWNWALARTSGWRLVMRIEDFDGPRIRAGAGKSAMETLKWLGLDWDDEPLVQSSDRTPYLEKMEALAESGLAYQCHLTRREIGSGASAPNEGDHELVFPANLRPTEAGDPRSFEWTEGSHWRFLTTSGHHEIVHDQISGDHDFEPAAECGDFVTWTVRDEPAYQLAVVVDDMRQGITDVVRGDDLLSSTARQQLLYTAFQSDPPRWWHMPLVRGADGRRLAKRHGDTRLDHYREAGVPPEKILGLLAWWCGLLSCRAPISSGDFLEAFDASRLPTEDVVYTDEDETWLTS